MRVTRSIDGTGGPITPDAIDEALGALDFVQPEPAEGVTQTEDIFEADPALASTQRSEPQQDDAPEEQATMIRDAFGNRRRAEQGPSDEKKMLVEMYGLPKGLADQVLSGKLKLNTALKIQRKRSQPTERPHSFLPVVRTLAIAAAAGLLILGSLYLLQAFTS